MESAAIRTNQLNETLSSKLVLALKATETELKNWVQNKIKKLKTDPLLDKDGIPLPSIQFIRW